MDRKVKRQGCGSKTRLDSRRRFEFTLKIDCWGAPYPGTPGTRKPDTPRQNKLPGVLKHSAHQKWKMLLKIKRTSIVLIRSYQTHTYYLGLNAWKAEHFEAECALPFGTNSTLLELQIMTKIKRLQQKW
eukprot:2953462-Rhodomonas_salina.1